MKIFFVDSSTAGLKNFLRMGVENLLVSYWYEKSSNLVNYILDINPKANIFLDSGAYSALTQGAEINVEDYIKFCHKIKHKVKMIASLDVIENGYKSKENYDIMCNAGLDVIPCYHSGEPKEILEYYCKKADYIAVGALVSLTAKPRNLTNYLSNIIDLIPRDKKIHLFGLTASNILFRFANRITSVDSSMVSRRSPYTSSVSYSGMVTNTKAMPYRINKQQNIDLQSYAIYRLLEMEKQINEHEEMKQCLNK